MATQNSPRKWTVMATLLGNVWRQADLKRTTAATAALAAALVLTGCGDQAGPEPAANSGLATEETTIAAETAPATEEPTDPGAPLEGDAEGLIYPETSPEGTFPPGVTAAMDQEGVFHGQVGDVVGIGDESTGHMVNIALDAVDYVEDAVPGKVVALLSFTVDNTQGTGPVKLLAPIDNGGWAYIGPQGVMESFYANTSSWSESFYGRDVTPMHVGPFVQGTKETNLVDYLVLDAPTGDITGEITYVDTMGHQRAVIELPAEDVNPDNHGIVRVHEIAAEFGYLIEPY
jgi:hypothetical protein